MVFDKNHKAIYFSRHTIPYLRNPEQFTPNYYKHIGIYGYTHKILQELIQLPESTLEKSEKLEQLRWIENGYSIYVSECEYEGIGVDTLRTRIGENGMDYKGYNIGIHEFGHNVEQTISLYEVENYFMRGVPNTGFTEALAFTFQNRDLELLGLADNDTINEDLNTLDIFWNCYEIMGVSLVDIKTWQWMYAHPKANAEQLRSAVLSIAKEVWNQYYAPIFKENNQVILACYSHIIVDPLYVSAYPIGHLVDFQLEQYLKGKKVGPEVERIFAMGHLTPDLWLQRAVGQTKWQQTLKQHCSQ